ncbi:hypothetical protein CEB3_c13610 [Peptococcaceae bacterium CEB3]|nr:hypothetical protein CEB3_c13610 [Peptococcaceae bacterium CEB3]
MDEEWIINKEYCQEALQKFSQEQKEVIVRMANDFEKSIEEQLADKIKILVFRPGQSPEVRAIPNTLKALQSVVGGYIEVIHLEDGLLLVCDEEGKLKGYPPNRRVGRDVICGTFFICRSDGDEFMSATDEDLKSLC